MKNIIENVADTQQSAVFDYMEKCVICGSETPYRVSTPINQREFYVEGAGQVCQKCYYECYIRKIGD